MVECQDPDIQSVFLCFDWHIELGFLFSAFFFLSWYWSFEFGPRTMQI
jgi:hypothetical protein